MRSLILLTDGHLVVTDEEGTGTDSNEGADEGNEGEITTEL